MKYLLLICIVFAGCVQKKSYKRGIIFNDTAFRLHYMTGWSCCDCGNCPDSNNLEVKVYDSGKLIFYSHGDTILRCDKEAVFNLQRKTKIWMDSIELLKTTAIQ